MCFTHGCDSPTGYEETIRKARKEHRCCECRLPIRAGETYQHVWGVWDGHMETFKTCAACHWLRNRIGDEESRHGCRGAETMPGFTGMYELAFDEAPVGRWVYGLLKLEMT